VSVSVVGFVVSVVDVEVSPPPPPHPENKSELSVNTPVTNTRFVNVEYFIVFLWSGSGPSSQKVLRKILNFYFTAVHKE